MLPHNYKTTKQACFTSRGLQVITVVPVPILGDTQRQKFLLPVGACGSDSH